MPQKFVFADIHVDGSGVGVNRYSKLITTMGLCVFLAVFLLWLLCVRLLLLCRLKWLRHDIGYFRRPLRASCKIELLSFCS